MKEYDRIKLVTFNGKLRPGKRVKSSEDYWKLIGEIGSIQQDPKEFSNYASFSKERRVLVKFDRSLKDYGLIAHNNIDNALWLLVTDIEIIQK
jgi:hypothetical protein